MSDRSPDKLLFSGAPDYLDLSVHVVITRLRRAVASINSDTVSAPINHRHETHIAATPFSLTIGQMNHISLSFEFLARKNESNYLLFAGALRYSFVTSRVADFYKLTLTTVELHFAARFVEILRSINKTII